MYHIIKLNICFNLFEIGCEKARVTDIVEKVKKSKSFEFPFNTFARTAYTCAQYTAKPHKYIYSNGACGWGVHTLKCNRLQTILMIE